MIGEGRLQSERLLRVAEHHSLQQFHMVHQNWIGLLLLCGSVERRRQTPERKQSQGDEWVCFERNRQERITGHHVEAVRLLPERSNSSPHLVFALSGYRYGNENRRTWPGTLPRRRAGPTFFRPFVIPFV
jgi:hypothetical protein